MTPWAPVNQPKDELERRYTLDEADRELRRRGCLSYGHVFEVLASAGNADPNSVCCTRCSALWKIETSAPTDDVRQWLCVTCDVLAIPSPGYPCWDAGHPHVVVKP